ncbi:hypothetical protein TNCV_4257491 [Trichonephila clavipes]|nr:hypothetical protein TNCV_4257491 [Trichonephila clavipes]
MCRCTIVHEPQVLVRSGRYSLQQLRKERGICIRVGFFNPITAVQIPKFVLPPHLAHLFLDIPDQHRMRDKRNNDDPKRTEETTHKYMDHDGRIHVRHFAGNRCLPEYVIEQHRGIAPTVMVWGAMSYHGQSNWLQIEGNLNINRCVREVLQS